jgi:hypothetical protein
VGKEGSRIVTLPHLGAASNVGVVELLEGLTMDRRSGLVWICKVIAVCVKKLGQKQKQKQKQKQVGREGILVTLHTGLG